MAGDILRALARRMIKTLFAAGVHKTDDENLDPSRMAKNSFFFQDWENTVGRRRQALAPQTMGPPDIFDAAICSRRPCPTLSGLAVGYVEIETLSWHELSFIKVLTSCNEKKTSCAACSRKEKRKKK